MTCMIILVTWSTELDLFNRKATLQWRSTRLYWCQIHIIWKSSNPCWNTIAYFYQLNMTIIRFLKIHTTVMTRAIVFVWGKALWIHGRIVWWSRCRLTLWRIRNGLLLNHLRNIRYPIILRVFVLLLADIEICWFASVTLNIL